MRRRHIVICGLTNHTVFFHMISYRHDFRRIKFTEHKMCVLIFSTIVFETFFILRITEREMIKMCIGLHVKCPLFLSAFNGTHFFDRFSKNNQISIIMKIRPMETSCCMRTDADKMKPVVVFRKFANAPKIGVIHVFF
jgi:hypothetical protein